MQGKSDLWFRRRAGRNQVCRLKPAVHSVIPLAITIYCKRDVLQNSHQLSSKARALRFNYDETARQSYQKPAVTQHKLLQLSAIGLVSIPYGVSHVKAAVMVYLKLLRSKCPFSFQESSDQEGLIRHAICFPRAYSLSFSATLS